MRSSRRPRLQLLGGLLVSLAGCEAPPPPDLVEAPDPPAEPGRPRPPVRPGPERGAAGVASPPRVPAVQPQTRPTVQPGPPPEIPPEVPQVTPPAPGTLRPIVPTAQPRPRFDDVSARAALPPDAGSGNRQLLGTGGGFAAFDLDGDDDLDLLVTGDAAPTRLYVHDGAFGLLDVTDSRGLGGLDQVVAVALGDCDGDGDGDFFFSRWGSSRLYRKEGAAFVDATEGAGVGAGEHLGSSSLFADLDGDGDADLVQLRYRVIGVSALVPETPRVLLNDGACRFEEAADALGLPAGLGIALAVVDFDEDGDPDLVTANDFGMHHAPSTLLENLGGRFADVGAARGLHARIYGMGAVAADFDGDGQQDVYLANFLHNPLFLARGAGFLEDAVARGAADDWYVDPSQPPLGTRYYDPQSEQLWERQMAEFVARYGGERPGVPHSFIKVSWATEAADFDADGAVDLFVADGPIGAAGLFPEGTQQPDALLWNDGRGHFRDVAVAAGVADRGAGRGAVAADFDADGRPDLAVFAALRRGQPEPNHGVYRNTTDAGHFLRIVPQGAGHNVLGLGAEVRVRAGGRAQVKQRWLYTGAFGAKLEPVHVGLGEATVVDEVRVRWPWGGGEDCAFDVPANGELVIAQGAQPCP